MATKAKKPSLTLAVSDLKRLDELERRVEALERRQDTSELDLEVLWDYYERSTKETP